MGLDNLCLLIRFCSIVRKNRRAEISVIDRIMDRDCDFKGLFVGEEATRNASPHRLQKPECLGEKLRGSDKLVDY